MGLDGADDGPEPWFRGRVPSARRARIRRAGGTPPETDKMPWPMSTGLLHGSVVLLSKTGLGGGPIPKPLPPSSLPEQGRNS